MLECDNVDGMFKVLQRAEGQYASPCHDLACAHTRPSTKVWEAACWVAFSTIAEDVFLGGVSLACVHVTAVGVALSHKLLRMFGLDIMLQNLQQAMAAGRVL